MTNALSIMLPVCIWFCAAFLVGLCILEALVSLLCEVIQIGLEWCYTLLTKL